MFDRMVMAEIVTAARGLGVEPAALAAIAHIESGGRSHAMVGGRPEPLIRFEGHYFDRRLAGPARKQARREGLASPQAGAVANPPSQAARWTLLARAAAIDRAAAYESTSWGLGQVMGAHWAWLGYASAEALVADARAGAAGQMLLVTRYIAKAGLDGALRSHHWAAFARGYNGPAYRRNGYATKLAKAYARYSRQTAALPSLLRIGARGEDVRALQTALTMHGYPLAADGLFGPLTDAAVRRFQARQRLAVDGIAGPATLGALRQAEGGLLWRMLAFIARLFRRG